MSHKPRDYQAEDIEKIFQQWETVKSTLYVAATGLGKTKIAVEVSKRTQPKRTLFLAHRGELIFQAREAFLDEGLECSIEKAELMASTNLFTRSPVVLATVQTLQTGEIDRKRMTRFKPEDFGLLVYDESHHSVAPGNKSVVEYFTNGNPNLKVLGITATPGRADEEALGQIFESVAAERDILFGINNGWLVDIEQMFIPTTLDWSHIRTTAGDLNNKALSAVMESEAAVQAVVQPTLEALCRLQPMALKSVPVEKWGEALVAAGRSRWRRAIVFTASVRQAETLSNIFNRVLPDLSAWVCGKTPDDQRDQIFEHFKTGARSILTNVGVATEGYDNPFVDMIVFGRPTKSEMLYRQMLGRGTRVLPGLVENLPTRQSRRLAITLSAKPKLLVMDFVGNAGKHKLISSADVLGGNVSEEAAERAVKRAKKSAVPVNMTDLLKDEEEKLRKKLEQQRLDEEARRSKLVARVDYSVQRINPFSSMDLMPARRGAWDGIRVLSEKGAAFLIRQGFNPDDYTYSQAVQLIRESMRRFKGRLATPKQCEIIKRFYPEMNTREMTQVAASNLIQAVADAGWKRNQPTREAIRP